MPENKDERGNPAVSSSKSARNKDDTMRLAANYLILSKMLIILGAFGAEDYAQMLVHQHVVDHPSNPVL